MTINIKEIIEEIKKLRNPELVEIYNEINNIDELDKKLSILYSQFLTVKEMLEDEKKFLEDLNYQIIRDYNFQVTMIIIRLGKINSDLEEIKKWENGK